MTTKYEIKIVEGYVVFRLEQNEDGTYTVGFHLANYNVDDFDVESWIRDPPDYWNFKTQRAALFFIIDDIIKAEIASPALIKKILVFKRTIPFDQLSLFDEKKEETVAAESSTKTGA